MYKYLTLKCLSNYFIYVHVKNGFDDWDSPINVEFALQRTYNDQAFFVYIKTCMGKNKECKS